ncbi:hypothetical protein [Vibrio harveyi]
MNHALKLEDDKKRFDKAALSLSKVSSLCLVTDEAKEIKEKLPSLRLYVLLLKGLS